MVAALKEYEKQYGVTITFSVETEPLGTAGPLALARDILGKDDSPFFVLNSDVICDYPFEQIRDFHKSHGNEGTIIVSHIFVFYDWGQYLCNLFVSRLPKLMTLLNMVLLSIIMNLQKSKDLLRSLKHLSVTRLMLVFIFSIQLY